MEFSWKAHFLETYRVGDEGTDQELEELFQPIKNRVEVTGQDVKPTTDVSEEVINKLPYRGMAEGLLQHAVQRSLGNWLQAANNGFLPPPETPGTVTESASGYKLAFKMQAAEVEMFLLPDLRLQSAALKNGGSAHFETLFTPGPQDFLLTSWTMGEDGDSSPGHRLIFTYTYQTVDGWQLPEHVAVVRESHKEVWRYKLTDCHVKASK